MKRVALAYVAIGALVSAEGIRRGELSTEPVHVVGQVALWPLLLALEAYARFTDVDQ